MAKKEPNTIDNDVKKLAYAACLTHYCYKQNYCTNKCLIQKQCIKMSLSNGYDDGNFKRWPLPALEECMKITNSLVSFYIDGRSQTIPEENN